MQKVVGIRLESMGLHPRRGQPIGLLSCNAEGGVAMGRVSTSCGESTKCAHSSMINALNNQGKLEWMALRDPMNRGFFLSFLRKMIKYRKRKNVLIVNDLKLLHGRVVQEWVEVDRERIELVFLPACGPQINHDEYLNNGLKQVLTSKRPMSSSMPQVKVFMLMLSDVKKHVLALFHHTEDAYACSGV